MEGECPEEANPNTLKTKHLDLSRENALVIPKDIIFPNELNQYLKDQVQYYLHENSLLQKRLSDYEAKSKKREEKLQEYSTKIREYEILCGKNEFITSSAVAANKIVELSKKLREKCSELETYKTRCSKLEHNLFELKEELHLIEKPVEVVEPPQNELVEQVKQLQDKLSHTKNKLLETKNQNSQLKNDLKLANKWLQQETGENFENLASIHNTNSNWRGRAQIIFDLQTKNSDLREQLKNLRDKEPTSDVSPNLIKQDKKLNASMQENAELKKNIEEIKKKYDGIRARAKYLESDSTVLRNKISRLNELTDKYKQEIESLRKQVVVERENKESISKQKELLMNKSFKEQQNLKIELEKRECAMENLLKQIEEQKEEINILRNKVRSSRPPSSYGNRPNNKTSFDDKTVNRLEAERLKLLELTELQNKRLENERSQLQKIESELRYEKQRAAKLESNLARMELEHSSKSSTYSTGIATNRESETETLRNQLELAEENIKALKTRLEVEKHERKVDLQQFATILKNSDNGNSNTTE